jgi:hypothetical protein
LFSEFALDSGLVQATLQSGFECSLFLERQQEPKARIMH